MLGQVEHFEKIQFDKDRALTGLHLIADKLLGITRCPKIAITMSGGPNAKRIFLSHTKPHRKLRVIGDKTLGVALTKVPNEISSIFKGGQFREARRKANRASRLEFRFQKDSSIKYLDSIYLINTSAPIRQNRLLDDYMVDMVQIREFCEMNPEIYGIFDSQGELKAYAQGAHCGEVFVLQRFIGHRDALKHGIMFLLMFELLTDMVNIRKSNGVPLWVQHDMYFARSGGARQFKKECGFNPYKVKWLWRDEPEGVIDRPLFESSEDSSLALLQMPRTSR